MGEWRTFWDFLTLLGDLGQLGITLCPGCAARIGPPVATDRDGRQFHLGCHRVCGGCQQTMQRDNDDGEFTCRDDRCEAYRAWANSMAYQWDRIVYQYGIDQVAKARGTDITVKLPEKKRTAGDTEDLVLVGSLLNAVDRGLRMAPASATVWRDWMYHVIRFWQAAYTRYNQEHWEYAAKRKALIDFWGEAQDRFCHDRKALRALAFFWKRAAAALGRSRTRLLNYDAIEKAEDATDRRFAQLEID